ncbi:ATP-binding protein [Actinorugispora endophytica]|uniref:Anti-sigma regulatory factor (Ser/Thr protein kinase) n=1 Tax=Actinorugispora endophytica TaxID=1605990 RepID=A0A4R6UN64_9ACTN|nr:ATP-binding protein [Actinorugispora endophytica]TDQ46903.1 anti-sigma regulatory factor (Ser/Thr protein kinase) [Actinorugispora endophytica]
MATVRDPVVVPGDVPSLELVTRYVLSVVDGLLTPPAVYRMRLAADEVATNIVTHGYAENDRTGVLEVDGGADGDRVWIRFRDSAPPFDPRDRCHAPDLAVPLARRPVGGLGLHLVFTMLDDFEYEREGDRNRNTLIMRRDPAR